MPASASVLCRQGNTRLITIWAVLLMPCAVHAQSALETTFSHGSVLAAYGQLNLGYLGYDDGQK